MSAPGTCLSSEEMMTRFTHLLGAIFCVLMMALSLVAPYTRARAQEATPVISNTATASWLADGRQASVASNRVDIRLDGVTAQKPQLDIFRLTRNGATQSLAGASCTTSNGTSLPFSFEGVWGYVPVGAVPLQPATEIKAGEPLIFGVTHQASNRNPTRLDTKEIVFTNAAGDEEVVTMIETGVNTGYFMGALMTRATPPSPTKRDCVLSVLPGEPLRLGAAEGQGEPVFADGNVNMLIDPYGITFDSVTGESITGVKVSIVDAVTGQPAEVYGDDGVSRYPSTVYTGQTVVDSGGTVYTFPIGDYRFPLMPPGRYRLVVEPEEPYTFPSGIPAEELAHLDRPDGGKFAILPGSYGGVIELFDPAPVRVDIPLDKPGGALLLTKTASEIVGQAGDTISYQINVTNSDPLRPSGVITLTDLIPAQMRLREGTVRIDGQKIDVDAGPDGAKMTLVLPRLKRASTMKITYALEIRSDAREGDALNRVTAVDDLGNVSNVADALVRIERDSIADRMTIIGRVVEAACSIDPDKAPGIAGVRVMMEDGSYAVTDMDGRYHFEGVVPGTHVVQLDDSSLVGHELVDCAQSTRSAGRSFSRFVEGRGGSLKRVDFRAVKREGSVEAVVAKRPQVLDDAAAAGGGRDWLTETQPGVIDWLFPATNFNPRAPVTRVAISHLADQTVRLSVDGKPVDPLQFESVSKGPHGSVSLWRAVPINGRKSLLTAEVLNADGSVAKRLEREVYYSNTPVQAEFLRDKSVLVADGVTRPVIAVRLTDRHGKPIHHDVIGDFEVPAPYYPAVEVDAQQARQLAGLERAQPVWRVHGDEGIAYIELEPTTASGTVSIRFDFRDGEAQREQRLEAWLDPGDRPWTVVGLAQGTVGFNKLQGHLQDLKDEEKDTLTDGRLALYAKGKISGQWLMTLAYDSDKKEDETRFAGIIDPRAYYTVYADTSERRYDAASIRKLYLRLERRQFYALFGDFETGIDEPELARYTRSLNGVKAEYGSDRVSALAFAADTPTRFRRDEIQGNGLSGPYALGAREIMANSERIQIEVRDRERSDRVVDTRLLTRYIDYEIDYVQGLIRFKEPILSRTSDLDPQFIIATYEVDGVGERQLNAGARASWRSKDQKLQVAATAIHDSNDGGKTLLGGADVRYRPDQRTEIRAEVAVSDARPEATGEGEGGTATAWLVEAEHHGEKFDALAYVRQQDGGFGAGQISGANAGTRKIGIDGRVGITDALQFTGSAWHETGLGSDLRRIAARGLLEYRSADWGGRAGFTFAQDRLADGRQLDSTILQLGANRRFFDNKLELDAQTEIPLSGNNDSVDFPARHRLAARYSLTQGVQLIGNYEIADGRNIDARTAKLGFEVQPWTGAKVMAMGNVQQIAEYGARSFAAFGLSQSLVLDEHWSIDATVDSNRSLGGIDPSLVVNPDHPVSAGGQLSDGVITEDFTALTAGATYRSDLWSVSSRAEYRMSELGDRYGATVGAIRQIGEGQAIGGAASYLVAKDEKGASTRTADVQFSWAHRPAGSRIAFLDKVEVRAEKLENGVLGQTGPIGLPSLINGDASSLRVINSLSLNWSPLSGGRDDDQYLERSEFSLFWGSRYASEKIGDADIKGWSNVVGLDGRIGLGERFDIGGAFTIRQGLGSRSFAYSGGPSIGISPVKNSWISLGWNIVGFEDRDFEESRYTRSGPYATLRFKFDQNTLQGLGLGRR